MIKKVLRNIVYIHIKIFYWFVCLLSAKKIVYINASIHPIKHNWGDDVSIIIARLISTDKLFIPLSYSFSKEKKENILCIGSIVTWLTNSRSIIWGSGVLKPEAILNDKPKKVYAVRGPLTREYLIRNGVKCPEIYGDPAMLFPLYYTPNRIKRYKIGIIPHFRDQNNPILKEITKIASLSILVIDVRDTKNWRSFIDYINSCDIILSSSLHGIIIADSYRIPNVWIELFEGESKRFPFRDYFMSVNKDIQEPHIIDSRNSFHAACEFAPLWKAPQIDVRPLLDSCPFK